MAQDKNYLKQRFARTGAEPTAEDFANLIDAIPDETDSGIVADQAAEILKADSEFIKEVSPKTTNDLTAPSEDTLLTSLGTKQALQDIQADYNEKIGIVSAQASTAIVGVADVNTVPVDTTDVFRKYSVKQAGTYVNFLDVNGAPIEVIAADQANGIEGDLESGIVELWGQDNVWSKSITKISLEAYAKKTEVAQISNVLNNTPVNIGASDDLGTYLNTNTAYYVRINNSPFVLDRAGTVQQLSVNCTTAGKLKFSIWNKVDDTHMTLVYEVNVTAGLGVNTFTAGVDFDAFTVLNGQYLGVTQVTGEALVALKTHADGSFSSANTTSVIGSTVVISISPAEFAIAGIVIMPGTISAVADLNTQVVQVNNKVESAVKKTDIIIKPSSNLAKPAFIVYGKYVNNAGGLSNGPWAMFFMPVKAGQVFTIGRWSMTWGSYYSFFDLDGVTPTGTYGAIAKANYLPFTLPASPRDSYMAFDLARPTDPVDGSGYAQLTVNLGTELLDYEDPNKSTLLKVLGADIGGGNSNVQNFADLADAPNPIDNIGNSFKYGDNGLLLPFKPIEANTDAVFATVKTNAVICDLPVGNSVPPAQCKIGDEWIDADADGTRKRRMI